MIVPVILPIQKYSSSEYNNSPKAARSEHLNCNLFYFLFGNSTSRLLFAFANFFMVSGNAAIMQYLTRFNLIGQNKPGRCIEIRPMGFTSLAELKF